MANKTGLIIGVSVVGVAVIGVSIYFLTKKKDTPPPLSNNIQPRTGDSMLYPTRPNTSTSTPPINNVNNDKDGWWKGIASSVGSNLGNQLVDSIFKPKNKTSTGSNSGYSSGFDEDKPSTWSDDDADRWMDSFEL